MDIMRQSTFLVLNPMVGPIVTQLEVFFSYLTLSHELCPLFHSSVLL